MVKFWGFIFALNLWTRLFYHLVIYHLLFLITSKQGEKAFVRVCREKPQFGQIQRLMLGIAKHCAGDTR